MVASAGHVIRVWSYYTDDQRDQPLKEYQMRVAFG
jgi:hypothetical protein